MVNYLWPMLIVLLSPVVLKGYRLRWYHGVGGVIAFSGAALVVAPPSISGHGIDLAHLSGLALAFLAALIWAGYSVMTKRLALFSSAAVAQFCAIAGILSLVSHAALEPPVRLDARDWTLLAILGLGPMGIAFYTWDAALKRGDPRVIGALSYLTPLLSTLGLVWFGAKPFTGMAAVAMGLILLGALLGSQESWRRKSR